MDRQGYQRTAPPTGGGEDALAAGADHARFHDRLDEIAARLDRLAQRTQARSAMPAVDEAHDDGPDFEARLAAARPTGSAGPSFSLDDAVAEIAARQHALDVEADGFKSPARAAPTPAVNLSGIEHLLHDISGQIETLRRPCPVEDSVEALRRELVEIGRTVTAATPQPSLDAMHSELQSIAERIDRGRAPAADAPALSAIERGLNEVRDALNARPPARSQPGSADANALARNGTDPETLDHLESAIAELRNVSTRVASGDQLAALANDVRAMGAKLDRVSPPAAPAPDGMDDLIRRMDALAVALEGRPEPSERAEGAQIESQLNRLTDQLDAIEAAADRRGFKQLEGQIAQLTQKLEAADERLGNLGAIEHAVADLVEQLQDTRASALDAAEQAARAAVREMVGTSPGTGPEVGGLKQELADFRATQADIDRRTQDLLETLQGTLERLVDRLAAIETDVRPATAPAGLAPEVAPSAPPVMAQPGRPMAPAGERRPINAGLPADHPLEPGTGAPRGRAPTPAERIAASEAMLPPRPAAEPAGKANFIAAARRAAQAAAADASWEGTRSPDERPRGSVLGTVGGAIAKRRRPLMIGIGIILLVLGTLQLVTNFLGSGGPRHAPTETTGTREETPAAPALPNGMAAPTDAAPVPSPVVPPAPADKSENAPADPAATSAPSVPNFMMPVDVTGSTGPATIAVAPPIPAAAAPPPLADKPLPPTVGPGLRSAALAGNPAAEYELAVRYADGRGVPASIEEAAHWFERAANHGLAPAQYRLGSLYEKGQGVKKDLEAARRLYTAAATKGNGKAMHNLAVLYAEGLNGDPDYRAASEWFRKAADRGVADSQYNLGILYARGIGVERNLAESYKWFALAAQQGDKDAVKKRDDVAGRLDAQSLAAARLAVQTFTADPQPADAVEVKAPPGGWEKPAAAARPGKVKPAVGSPRKLSPT
jgi:localization factor PodJL